MDLNASKGEKCVIVGTLYKHQELKPSVLHDVSKEVKKIVVITHVLLPLYMLGGKINTIPSHHPQYQTVPPPARTHFVSDKDELILEDETQRVTLQGSALNVHHVVTGCVVSVLGTLQNNGVFLVEDYCWPEAESVGRSLPELKEDKYVPDCIPNVSFKLKLLNDFYSHFLADS